MIKPHPTGADAELSFLRAPVRRRAVIMLSSLTEARPRQLARAIGIDVSRLRMILYGRPPRYSIALSPIQLGLIAEVQRDRGALFIITEKGRRKARMWTARQDRRQGKPTPVGARAAKEPESSPGVPTPGASMTWQVWVHPADVLQPPLR